MTTRIANLLRSGTDDIVREWIGELRTSDCTEAHKQLPISDIAGNIKIMIANIAGTLASREVTADKAIAASGLPVILSDLIPASGSGVRDLGASKRTQPLGTRPLNNPIVRAEHAMVSHGKMRHAQGCVFHEVLLEFAMLRQAIFRQLSAQIKIVERDELAETLPLIDRTFDELMLVALESFYDASVHDLEKRAVHDPLTQLYNKEYFGTRLGEELRRSLRSGDALTLAMIDMDELKKVNDTYGHGTGDRVIQAVAAAIRNNCRRGDIPCRYGGDEFMVILPETGKVQARVFAERVARTLRDMTVVAAGDGTKIAQMQDITSGVERKPLVIPLPTVSVGLVSFPDDGRNPETLVAKVDVALYRAKRGGRNRIEY
ncbi:MAG TPA: GGDEF domain-containing protein [Chloroflexia bacterium]|nr:GGDEF domain-containing protein [Chloroflexia bacterium]